MNNTINVPIIGFVHNDFKEKFGIPRQPNLVDTLSFIEMLAPYDEIQAFEGIDKFSHLWLIWQFHDNKRMTHGEHFMPLIRPPRLGGNAKVGVFASRSMYRPSQIGLSVVQFKQLKREQGKTRLYVSGADLLHGTPIIDIKPYLAYADAITHAQSGYAAEAPRQLQVIWNPQACIQRDNLIASSAIHPSQLAELEQILALDPTPSYQQDDAKIYGLGFGAVNVKFKRAATQILIVDIAASD